MQPDSKATAVDFLLDAKLGSLQAGPLDDRLLNQGHNSVASLTTKPLP